MNAISIVIDGWHAGYLGCYGNSWIDTPAIDELAAWSQIFDQATIDSPELNGLYQAYWTGQCAAIERSAGSDAPSLPQRLRQAGVTTALVTDEPLVAGTEFSGEFDEVVRVESPAGTKLAGELEETRLARLFAAAAEWLESAKGPFLLWIHAQGLTAPWDAPLEFRAQYVDGDGVESLPDAAVPRRVLPPDFDPDELLPIRWAYAGQVALLDQCLAGLVDGLRTLGLIDETLLAIVGSRGFPLGEHRRVGGLDVMAGDSTPDGDGEGLPWLYEELIHVPWLLRLPRDPLAPARSQALVQPADLGATLLDALGCATGDGFGQGHSLLAIARDEADAVRDRAIAIGPADERSLRTRRWRLQWRENEAGLSDSAPALRLYVKPDDRWEVNDVANRCDQVIEPLHQAFRDYLLNPKDPAPLPEVLNVEQE